MRLYFHQRGKRDAKKVWVRACVIHGGSKKILFDLSTDPAFEVIPDGNYIANIDWYPPTKIDVMPPLLIATRINWYDEAAQKDRNKITYFRWGSRMGPGVMGLVTPEVGIATMKEADEMIAILRAENVTFP